MILHLSIFYSTFFFVGFFPLIPGTIASLFSIPLFLLIYDKPFLYISLLLVILLLSIISIPITDPFFQKKDPQPIVIDEVIGSLIALAFLQPQDGFFPILLSFLLFRFFDILKPFPINSIQNVQNPWGIILDDCLAGIFANLSIHAYLFVDRLFS